MGVDKTVNVMEQRSHNYVTLHAKRFADVKSLNS